MKKLLTQGLVIIFIFFSLYFILTRVDWVRLLRIQQFTEKTEKQLGDFFLEVFKNNEEETVNTKYVNAVDSIVNGICSANNIRREKIKVTILEKEDINAFALPGGQLIVYTGLIENSKHQDELTGVIAHELAHIELSHVMKKLGKELGISVLVSIAGGSAGAETVKEAIRILSSSAFDRSMEKEADIKAVDYLIQAEVNSNPFAEFLNRLAEKEDQSLKYLTWISTHPDSKDRSSYIIEYSKGKRVGKKSLISNDTWKKLKEVK
jgi:predicted Zn-dependent protease